MKNAWQKSQEQLQRSDKRDGHIVRLRTPRTLGYLTVAGSTKEFSANDRPRPSAKIESSGVLSGNLKARVRANLTRIYGPLRFSFVEIPALVGGMRITIGNDLYCGGIRDTLKALE